MSKTQTIKIGDVVTVVDHAWSKIFTGSLVGERVSRTDTDGRVRTFKVLAIGCKIPNGVPAGRYDFQANTLIMSEDIRQGCLYPEIVAINACNLQQSIVGVGIHYIAAGKDVTTEISQESKRAILLAHLDSV